MSRLRADTPGATTGAMSSFVFRRARKNSRYFHIIVPVDLIRVGQHPVELSRRAAAGDLFSRFGASRFYTRDIILVKIHSDVREIAGSCSNEREREREKRGGRRG